MRGVLCRQAQGRWAGVRGALGSGARQAWRAAGARGRGAAAARKARGSSAQGVRQQRARRAAAARKARGSSAQGARQQRARRTGRVGNGRQARRGCAGARGWAHGARGARPAWAWPGRWMGAQAGLAGPVFVHCAPGSVLARFLDPVRLGIFLSHQMNTLHGKINFQKKKILLNSNKNQINFDKIFEK